MKLVSVIIPTHDGPQHIRNAIDSVIEQDYPNVEIIVVDDNGVGTRAQIETENQIAIYRGFPGFYYIKHDINRNGSAARNTGARFAKGEYLNFLDDDDCLGPGKLSYQVRQLDGSGDWGLSYSTRIIKYDGRVIREVLASKSGDILFDFLMGRVNMGTAAVLMRKTVWMDVNGFDETYVRHQDWEFFARVLNRYKAIASPAVWYERNYTFRHSPKNIGACEEHARHFIKGIRKNISSLTSGEVELVCNQHMLNVAHKYLRKGCISDYWRIISEFGGPRTIPTTMVQGVVWVRNRLAGRGFT